MMKMYPGNSNILCQNITDSKVIVLKIKLRISNHNPQNVVYAYKTYNNKLEKIKLHLFNRKALHYN